MYSGCAGLGECSTCDTAAASKATLAAHKCTANLSDASSSSAAERLVIADVVADCNNSPEGVVNKAVTLDGDLKTYDYLRELFKGNEEILAVWLDKNHIAKNLFSALMDMRVKMYKGNPKVLCKVKVTRLCEGFMQCLLSNLLSFKNYTTMEAVEFNVDSPVLGEIVAKLEQALKHYFNMGHAECGSWCRAGEESYRPNLPGGVWLDNSEELGLYRNTKEVWEKYCQRGTIARMLWRESSSSVTNEPFHAGLWKGAARKDVSFPRSLPTRVHLQALT